MMAVAKNRFSSFLLTWRQFVLVPSWCAEADPGGGGGRGFTPPHKDCPADSEIWRKGVADRL